jgi:hypothetical protein
MAATAGKVGAVYFRKARIQGTGIAFVDSNPDTITDTGSGFVTAGFEAGDLITVSGTTNNNTNYTIDTGGAAAGTLTLVAGDTVTAEGAGANVTIQEALPGTQVLGFFNWTLNNSVDLLEVTRFEDAGVEKSIPGIKRWTATAEKHFESTQLTTASWLGDTLLARFFTRYDASPDVTNAYFYEGYCIVEGIDVTAENAGVVNETITFKGSAKASIIGTGIAFVDSDPDTITDSGSGFITAGFDAGDKITVEGSTNNDGDYTLATVAAGTLTLISGDSLTAEGAGARMTISAGTRLTTRSTAWPT